MMSLSLVNEKEEIVRQGFVRAAARGGASAYLRLPFDQPSGMYRLALCAHDSTQSRLLALAQVPVYNDLEPWPAETLQVPLLDPAPPVATRAARLELEKERFRPREEVAPRLLLSAEAWPLAASLAAVDQALLGEADAPALFRGDPLPGDYLPPTAITARGLLRDSAGMPLKTFSLAAFIPRLDTVLYALSDDAGRFAFDFPALHGDYAVQFIDFMHDEIEATIAFELPDLPPPQPLRYTESIARYLELSRQRKKIYQSFGRLESPPLSLPPAILPLPRRPDRVFILRDYPDFGDLPGFFREVPSPLDFRRDEDKWWARMFNPASRVRSYFGKAPLFLVNGRLTRDAHYIAGMKTQALERVSLFFLPKTSFAYFGRLGLNGVVVIDSREALPPLPANDARNIHSIPGLIPEAAFPAAIPEQKHLPAFRPLVFWQSRLEVGTHGQATARFHCTDDLGEFVIWVVAQDEGGEIYTARATYRVAP
jgi:hypothetical protein